uniref:Lipocalin/cytosolic fatty-acid binding domain-containing protein n=1 Tax=Peromyscus maniculatus bairdii TaxID=230844 RepID=A0A8C8W259_PERMB
MFWNVSSGSKPVCWTLGEHRDRVAVGSSPCLVQVSGIWYTKAIMHNDSLPGDKMPMKAFPMKVTALEGGNLETKITFWRKGHCHDFKILMKKTEEPGKYIACNGRKTVYIEELPVKDHYIFYCEGRHHGKYFSIGKLVGHIGSPFFLS